MKKKKLSALLTGVFFFLPLGGQETLLLEGGLTQVSPARLLSPWQPNEFLSCRDNERACQSIRVICGVDFEMGGFEVDG